MLTLGRRVIKSVGLKIIKLDPVAALGIQLSTFLVVFLGTWLGMPLSTTHVLVGALAGLGLERGVWVNVRRLRRTTYVWLATFIMTATITIVTHHLIVNFQ